MLFKKTKKAPVKKNNQFSLINDYGDLKFILVLSEKSADNWISYHCSLNRLNFQTGSFQEIYSSESASIISDTTPEELKDLTAFFREVEGESNIVHSFSIGNKDFSLKISNNEDMYRVTAIIDMVSMTSERLDAGTGDSEVSLTFNCGLRQLKDFYEPLDKWLKS